MDLNVLRPRGGRPVVALTAVSLLVAGLVTLVQGLGDGTWTDRVVMTEFAYAPDHIVLPAGRPDVTLELVNAGAVPHDFSVEGLPEDVPVHLAVIEGGAVPWRLRPLPAGRYTVYCALEGHREAGMEATLEVR